jgi:hypothetical protein
MKFINQDGKVVDGAPLTDRQASAIERLEEYLHEKVCGNSHHGTYSKKLCAEVARELISKLDDSAVGSLCAALFEPEPVKASRLPVWVTKLQLRH